MESYFQSQTQTYTPSKSIFSSALQGVKKNINGSEKYNKFLSNKNRNVDQLNDDIIDFEMESLKLGDFQEKTQYNNKLRSAVVNNSDSHSLLSQPFPVSKHKKIDMKEIRGGRNDKLPKQINIKNKNGNIITLKKSISSEIKTSNGESKWQHDFFNEVPVYKYLVFIRNMPRILTEQKIRDLFSEYGTIIGVNIERDTAEVYFNRKDQAELAAEKTNGKEIFGKQIKVTYYENKEEGIYDRNSNNNLAQTNYSNRDRSKSKKKLDLDYFHVKKDDIWDRIKFKNDKEF